MPPSPAKQITRVLSLFSSAVCARPVPTAAAEAKVDATNVFHIEYLRGTHHYNFNDTKFFIVTAEATSWLDGAHTNFGEIISGMEIVDKIESLETDSRDRPVEDIIIQNVELIEK